MVRAVDKADAMRSITYREPFTIYHIYLITVVSRHQSIVCFDSSSHSRHNHALLC